VASKDGAHRSLGQQEHLMDFMSRFNMFRQILADLGTPIRSNMQVFDFGCGKGDLVKAAVALGIDAYGCDLYDTDYSSHWNSE
jgi:2-polyprenyl-3-methyl-5-hydroxy-6-metoxy-1,4-benzoquinol methylase